MSDVEKHFPQEEKLVAAEHLERVSSGGEGDGHVKLPSRMFTPAEEKKLYRKVDLRIMPILSLLYLLSFMDRGNIGNARLEGLEKDLKLTSQQYNTALSCFFVTYCLCEVPANLIMKKFRRPSRWLGLCTVCWSIVMTLMGTVNSFGGLVATRLFLGITECGLFPGVILYISIWYPRHLSQTRVALFFGAATLAGAFSGLLAYGISFMAGVGGYNGWRWIFILEGLATFIVGVSAFFLISDFPADCKWLTDEEREWLIYRKATDSSSVGEAEHVAKNHVWQALTDWQTYVALYAISLISPTLINSFGKYTRAESQLMTLPVYIAACIFVLVTSLLADRQKKRFVYMMLDLVLCAVGLIINLTPAPTGVKYFGLILTACGAYGGLPTSVTWLTNNLSGQTKRATGSAFQIGIGNLGALASTNAYRTKDKPRYIMGHSIMLAFTAIGLVAAPLYAFLLERENKKKLAYQALPDGHPDKKVWTAEEIREAGDRAPEFMYTI
ncbi:RHTO0S18e02256g1_1 [Rhodotorula toruloides]|uniref:RHTO0S18e02256g1_1 n=1 Tax=Rhodotorula toruloides TaxID=5286 RepID=A0A061BEY5_RHOTO|nr:RHTO0S18e02256g1_1 [Rhodotorula toruloides]